MTTQNSPAAAAATNSHEDVAFSDLRIDQLLAVADYLFDESYHDGFAPLSDELLDTSIALCELVHFDGCIREAGLVHFVKGVRQANSESPANSMAYNARLDDFRAALAAHLADLYEAPPAEILLAHP